MLRVLRIFLGLEDNTLVSLLIRLSEVVVLNFLILVILSLIRLFLLIPKRSQISKVFLMLFIMKLLIWCFSVIIFLIKLIKIHLVFQRSRSLVMQLISIMEMLMLDLKLSFLLVLFLLIMFIRKGRTEEEFGRQREPHLFNDNLLNIMIQSFMLKSLLI